MLKLLFIIIIFYLFIYLLLLKYNLKIVKITYGKLIINDYYLRYIEFKICFYISHLFIVSLFFHLTFVVLFSIDFCYIYLPIFQTLFLFFFFIYFIFFYVPQLCFLRFSLDVQYKPNINRTEPNQTDFRCQPTRHTCALRTHI